YETHTLIWATGASHRKLGVPGEPEFTNKGVSYCATCDAPLFKNKVVAIVGSGDSAIKEALLLTEYAPKVYIFARKDRVHPEPINMQRLEAKIKEGKVEVLYETQVTEVKGDKFMTHVVLNREVNGSTDFPLQGLFVEIGAIPNSQLPKEKLGVAVDEKGYIITKHGSNAAEASTTNVVGFYAAGDVANLDWKQAITGVSEGVQAAYGAYQHIRSEEVDPR
ncbi:MAG: FAD-dependent oxidoreductase, partial [Candidatus Diapherotrites archaeon]|nr:FAD-dependent oxidoreductase [Candidatus Diapherotrites archaeon]